MDRPRGRVRLLPQLPALDVVGTPCEALPLIVRPRARSSIWRHVERNTPRATFYRGERWAPSDLCAGPTSPKVGA